MKLSQCFHTAMVELEEGPLLPSSPPLSPTKPLFSINPKIRFPKGSHALTQDSQNSAELLAGCPHALRSSGLPLPSSKKGAISLFLGNYPQPNPVQSRRHREMGTAKCPGGTKGILHLHHLILLSTNSVFKPIR